LKKVLVLNRTFFKKVVLMLFNLREKWNSIRWRW